MNYGIKTLVFKFLSYLPNQMGDDVYHFLQERKEAISAERDIEVKKKTYSILLEVLSKNNIDIKNNDVLEIGSGWIPTMPYLLKFLGNCRSVQTYDINHHFTPDRNAQLNKVFFRLLDIDQPSSLKTNPSGLPDGINYLPLTNIVDQPPAPTSIDVVFSRYLLEHMHPEDIYKIHKSSKKYMRENGVIIHFVSPSDHRAYFDKSLSLYDFLQYSEKQWNAKQTRFDYHNRLRLPQYVEIFEQAGLEIIDKQYSRIAGNHKQLEKFNNLKIHPDFQKYSFEELTASSLIFVLRVTTS